MTGATCELTRRLSHRRRLVSLPTGRAHLIGIGGAGMTALAEILADKGWAVSGSDSGAIGNAAALRNRRIRLHIGHDAHHVSANTDVAIYSLAVPADNPERQAASRLGVSQLSYAEMLGRLMHGHLGLCVAGTHGKSTTSAMTGRILEAAAADPTVAVGAQLHDWGASGRAGNGECFVAESCEYGGSFLHMRPAAAAILGIEPDHFDCYADPTALVGAFRKFAELVPLFGLMICRADCKAACAAVAGLSAPVETFSLRRGADWWAADLRHQQGRFRFRIFNRGNYFCEVRLAIPGWHNVLNALAATALANWAGVAPRDIRDGLEDFHGLQRRFDIVGHWCGVTLVNDYAHHPTEVRATLRTARQVFGRRRIWCVFQPHQISRTIALREEFAASFRRADVVAIQDIYSVRESDEAPGMTARDLMQDVARRGVPTLDVQQADAIMGVLQEQLQPGDVLITMGAGDVGNLCHAFLERFS